MNVLCVVIGAAIAFAAYTDAVSTLVTTRIRVQRFWPTVLFYRHTWPAWRALGLRFREEHRRERFFSVYGPLSILGLLIVWIALQLLGWGLIWYGLRDALAGKVTNVIDGFYFAGVDFFTIGFGDIVPVGGGARVLALVQAFLGVTTTALVIGYLPTLYAAYSEREQLLPTLDSLVGDTVTPANVLETYTYEGNPAPLLALFRDWEHWCAQVEQSHGAYPMLTFFRSRTPGRSWLAALTIVTDTAVVAIAVIDSRHTFEARMMYRRAVQAVEALRQFGQSREGLEPVPITEERLRAGYEAMGARGLQLRPFDVAWSDLQRLRAGYAPALARLSRELASPTSFAVAHIEMPTPDPPQPPNSSV